MNNLLIHFKNTALRLGIAVLIFSLCRILFYVFNASHFPDARFVDFLHGIRFDLSATVWIFLPFIFFSVLPLNLRDTRFWQVSLKVLFHLSNTLTVVLNFIDIEYFKFTLKRSGIELYRVAAGGEDWWSLIPAFIADYWYLILLAGAFIALSEFLYRRTQRPYSVFNMEFKPVYYLTGFLLFAASAALAILGARGGFQLTPLSPVDAGMVTSPANAPLVLNTPFTFIKSFDREIPEEHHFMPREEAQKLIPRTHKFRSEPRKDLNVVIIIMESFSNEHIGYFQENEGHTPYFDSLLENSLVFERCFANGKKSIEALPAILASVPSLMNTPFIQSPFSTNSIFSLADALKPYGYHTSFYHGGKNGTMGFDSFINMAGFDAYTGKNEYPHVQRDDDGHWGIYDEPFFRFFSEQLSKQQEPFLSTFFSLSSHHPYSIPEEHRHRFPEDGSPLLRSVRYADFALHRFFNHAEQQDWFDNTLFVLTSDHTGRLTTPEYKNSASQYRIPLAFLLPGDSALTGKSQKITQHMDIMPSVLDYLNYPEKVFCLGQSVFDRKREPYAVNYYGDTYQWMEGDYMLRSDLHSSPQVFNFAKDRQLDKNIADQHPEVTKKLNKRLRAFVQLYNKSMITNRLTKNTDE